MPVEYYTFDWEHAQTPEVVLSSPSADPFVLFDLLTIC